MIGTLSLSIPVEGGWTGGVLRVQHGAAEICYYQHGNIVDRMQYGAFFADCKHRIEPLESGYRVALVYNIVNEASKTRAKPPAPTVSDALHQKIDEFHEALEAISQTHPVVSKLNLSLAHAYTERSWHFDRLKTRDASLVHFLRLVHMKYPDVEAAVALEHIENVDLHGYTIQGDSAHYVTNIFAITPDITIPRANVDTKSDKKVKTSFGKPATRIGKHHEVGEWFGNENAESSEEWFRGAVLLIWRSDWKARAFARSGRSILGMGEYAEIAYEGG